MANRIFDNVIQVDSAMGNLQVVGGTSSNFTSYEVIGFAFRSVNTAGVCIFAANNTTDIVAHFDSFSHVGSGGLVSNPTSITFGRPLRLNSLKVPTLTAGTAWVYLA